MIHSKENAQGKALEVISICKGASMVIPKATNKEKIVIQVNRTR